MSDPVGDAFEQSGRGGRVDPTEMVPNPVVIEAKPVNAFKIALCTAVIVACSGMLISGNSPVSLQETLTFPAQILWSVMGIISAVSIMVGVYWKDRRDGLLIESPGLIALGFLLGAYGTAVYFTLNDAWGSLAAPLSFTLGVACFWRVWQIVREIRAAEKSVRAAEGDGSEDGQRAHDLGVKNALRREYNQDQAAIEQADDQNGL